MNAGAFFRLQLARAIQRSGSRSGGDTGPRVGTRRRPVACLIALSSCLLRTLIPANLCHRGTRSACRWPGCAPPFGEGATFSGPAGKKHHVCRRLHVTKGGQSGYDPHNR